MGKKKKILTIAFILVLFLISLYIALFAGYDDNGFDLFLKSFSVCDDEDSTILKILRYPRALKAVVAGACLALAGLFMQTVSKNPLAEPYITGISSGAGLGIVLSILFLNTSNYSFFGFLGAVFSSFVVLTFAGMKRFSVTKLILVGMSVNIFVSALISLIILTHSEKSYALMYVLSGGLSSSDFISNKMILSIFLIVLLFSAFLIPKLNFLRLDSSFIACSKEKSGLYTILIIIASAFLTSLSVFCAGILGFVGIIIPQISKILLGYDFRYLLFANILLGSSLILVADFFSRVLIYPVQIPLGLVISVIGAPVFVFFLIKKGDMFSD